MTQEESDQNCYNAYEKLCQNMGNMTSLVQLRIMVKALGADRATAMATLNSGLPEEVKSILLGVAKHIEKTNITN